MSGPMRRNAEEILEALDDAAHRIKRAFRDRQDAQAQKIRDNNRRITETDTDLADGVPDGDVPPPSNGKPHSPPDGDTSGPVVFYDPKSGATDAQQQQIRDYVDGCNEALQDGYISPTGRVSTSGSRRRRASAAAAMERNGGAYTGHAGHVPDTTWTGVPDPHSWLDLDASINNSLGSQSKRYPLGYKPDRFYYGGEYPS